MISIIHCKRDETFDEKRRLYEEEEEEVTASSMSEVEERVGSLMDLIKIDPEGSVGFSDNKTLFNLEAGRQ